MFSRIRREGTRDVQSVTKMIADDAEREWEEERKRRKKHKQDKMQKGKMNFSLQPFNSLCDLLLFFISTVET